MFTREFWHRSLHDKVLILITQLAVIVFLCSACLLDSDRYVVFLILATISFTWITIFVFANRERFRRMCR